MCYLCWILWRNFWWNSLCEPWKSSWIKTLEKLLVQSLKKKKSWNNWKKFWWSLWRHLWWCPYEKLRWNPQGNALWDPLIFWFKACCTTWSNFWKNLIKNSWLRPCSIIWSILWRDHLKNTWKNTPNVHERFPGKILVGFPVEINLSQEIPIKISPNFLMDSWRKFLLKFLIEPLEKIQVESV